jgi:uncharacterized protein YceH (UPF0502 family)
MAIDFAILLTPSEARVLGSLLEKEATTPDYYPLSLNALINACNQRSNRDPVTDLDEQEVRQATHRLEDLGLAGRAPAADGRVTKYEHWLGEAYNFTRAESALICVLLLRGPQTPGELRSRTDRLHSFAEIADVLAGLQKLSERTPPLVAVLPRQPGTKESRYTHLFCGTVESVAANAPSTAYSAPVAAQAPALAYAFVRPNAVPDDPAHEPRIAQLESQVAELTQKFDTLNKKFDDLFGD